MVSTLHGSSDIAFALLALPRSGTAWASAWLDAIHEPWATYRPNEFPAGRGLCCTGTWLYPELLERLPAERTIVLDRKSSRATMPGWALERFDALPYPRFSWADLWLNPIPIWCRLRPDERFNREDHDRLSSINIQAAPLRPRLLPH